MTETVSDVEAVEHQLGTEGEPVGQRRSWSTRRHDHIRNRELLQKPGVAASSIGAAPTVTQPSGPPG